MNMNIRHRLSGGLCAFGIATLCVGGLPAAHADDEDNGKYIEGSSAVVKFGDLNLQNPDGVEALYKRIQRAANKVCGDPRDIHTFPDLARRECVERAVAKAVSDVNNRHLTALYTRKTNKALG
jgi:UrcA family protein